MSESTGDDEGLLAHALRYADRGWSVIAVKEKQAIRSWKGYQEKPADPRALKRMFAREGVTGVAVIGGAVSRSLAIRDFDSDDAYNAWAVTNPDEALQLPTVKTGCGFHVYGRLEKEEYADFGDGELRGDRCHYTLCPPSLHPSGARYAFIVPLRAEELLPLPPSLLRRWGAPRTSATATPVTTPGLDQPNTLRPTATQLHVSGVVESAVAATLPTGPGQRNRRLFEFARILRGMMPDATLDDRRVWVRNWFDRALPFIATKDCDESWRDFEVAWANVKRPVGKSFKLAAEGSEIPPVADRLGYTRHERALTGLCWRLQCQFGDGPFFLGCVEAGDYLGIKKTQAHKLLRTLQQDGVIALVTKGSKASRKSSEWKFLAAA